MEISPQHGQALQTEVDLDDSTTSHLQNFDKVTIEHTIFFLSRYYGPEGREPWDGLYGVSQFFPLSPFFIFYYC